MASSPIPEVLDLVPRSRVNSFRRSRLPKYAIAILEALQFSDPETELLESLNETEWRKVLSFCDSSQLTLVLGRSCQHSLPDWVRSRINLNYRNNAQRFARLKASLLEIADALEARDIEYVTLKGLAHSPHFTPDPLLRMQGDIDLWCHPESVLKARDVLTDLEYFPCCKSEGRHLPAMARRTNWEWHGDYFAPDLP